MIMLTKCENIRWCWNMGRQYHSLHKGLYCSYSWPCLLLGGIELVKLESTADKKRGVPVNDGQDWIHFDSNPEISSPRYTYCWWVSLILSITLRVLLKMGWRIMALTLSLTWLKEKSHTLQVKSSRKVESSFLLVYLFSLSKTKCFLFLRSFRGF